MPRAPPASEHPRNAPREREPEPADPRGCFALEAENVDDRERAQARTDRDDGSTRGESRHGPGRRGERQVGGEEPEWLGREPRTGLERVGLSTEQADDDHGERPNGNDDGRDADERPEPGHRGREGGGRVGPAGGREEHGHRRRDCDPRPAGPQREEVRAAQRAGVTVDDGHAQVPEHDDEEGQAAGDIDGVPALGGRLRHSDLAARWVMHHPTLRRLRPCAHPGRPPNPRGEVPAGPIRCRARGRSGSVPVSG